MQLRGSTVKMSARVRVGGDRATCPWVCLCCHFHVDTKGRSATTTQSEEDLLVLAPICGDICAIREDSLDLHHVVDSKTKCVRQCSVSASTDPSTYRSNCSRASSNNSNIVGFSKLVHATPTLPCTKCHSIARWRRAAFRGESTCESDGRLNVVRP